MAINIEHTSERGEKHIDVKMEFQDWDGDYRTAWAEHPLIEWKVESSPWTKSRKKLEYITWDGRRWTAAINDDWTFHHCLNGDGPCHHDKYLQYIAPGGAKWTMRFLP